MNGSQYSFFDQAYRTGTDRWTHLPHLSDTLDMLHMIKNESMILDIGSGRGRLAFTLARRGHKVVGIEPVQAIVNQANEHAKIENLNDRVHFMNADVRKLPFFDNAFDVVIDVQTFQFLNSDDYFVYLREVERVLKPYGTYLNVSLSDNTMSFMGVNPKMSDKGIVSRFGVVYHFMDPARIQNIFSKDFEIKRQREHRYQTDVFGGDEIVLLYSLMRKRS